MTHDEALSADPLVARHLTFLPVADEWPAELISVAVEEELRDHAGTLAEFPEDKRRSIAESLVREELADDPHFYDEVMRERGLLRFEGYGKGSGKFGKRPETERDHAMYTAGAEQAMADVEVREKQAAESAVSAMRRTVGTAAEDIVAYLERENPRVEEAIRLAREIQATLTSLKFEAAGRGHGKGSGIFGKRAEGGTQGKYPTIGPRQKVNIDQAYLLLMKRGFKPTFDIHSQVKASDGKAWPYVVMDRLGVTKVLTPQEMKAILLDPEQDRFTSSPELEAHPLHELTKNADTPRDVLEALSDERSHGDEALGQAADEVRGKMPPAVADAKLHDDEKLALLDRVHGRATALRKEWEDEDDRRQTDPATDLQIQRDEAFKADMRAQAEFLLKRAVEAGLKSLEQATEAQFREWSALWRQDHPRLGFASLAEVLRFTSRESAIGEGGLSSDDLKAWYARHGFQPAPTSELPDRMVRSPKREFATRVNQGRGGGEGSGVYGKLSKGTRDHGRGGGEGSGVYGKLSKGTRDHVNTLREHVLGGEAVTEAIAKTPAYKRAVADLAKEFQGAPTSAVGFLRRATISQVSSNNGKWTKDRLKAAVDRMMGDPANPVNSTGGYMTAEGARWVAELAAKVEAASREVVGQFAEGDRVRIFRGIVLEQAETHDWEDPRVLACFSMARMVAKAMSSPSGAEVGLVAEAMMPLSKVHVYMPLLRDVFAQAGMPLNADEGTIEQESEVLADFDRSLRASTTWYDSRTMEEVDDKVKSALKLEDGGGEGFTPLECLLAALGFADDEPGEEDEDPVIMRYASNAGRGHGKGSGKFGKRGGDVGEGAEIQRLEPAHVDTRTRDLSDVLDSRDRIMTIATPRLEPEPGSQQGSNPGGWATDAAGQRWYVKEMTETRGKSEVLAGAVYRALGVPVPDTRWVDGQVQSKEVPGAQPMTAEEMARHPDVKMGLLADVLLRNWDAVGLVHDNVVKGADGRAWRIDVGGSLKYRAQGAAKPTANDEDVRPELKAMRDPNGVNPEAAAVFAGVSDLDLRRQSHSLRAFTDSKIAALVRETGADPDNARLLKARRDNLIAALKP